MKKAEFGSVAFFRRIISLGIVIILLVLGLALVLTSNKLDKIKDDLDYYKNNNAVGSVLAQGTGVQDGENFSYEALYPDMYVTPAAERTRLYDAERFAYLTFTGSPNEVTESILDALALKDVKATFFIYGGDTDEGKAVINRIKEDGHAIGVYAYELPQKELYASIETYMDSFYKEFLLIYEATGEKPNIFRFPGGTTNKYNALIRQPLASEMVRRGFSYYDWNCTGGDSLAGATKDSIVENAIQTGGEKQRIFLMLHSTKANGATAQALPEIIDHFRDAGYEFRAITNDIQPMAFE
ncbi:MAG: polysaccharide deacetylase family protein [Firmicutes bacterium]|nr:polysaccharide deacetylase family protein [Bacillota bacterium]